MMQESVLAARDSEPAARGDLAWIAGSTALLHAGLALRFPAVYGGDTIVRLVNFPRIQIGYQLPVFQVLLHGAQRALGAVAGAWLLMALVAVAGTFGLHALVRALSGDDRAASAAALLYVTHPFVLYYGRVPYQEPLLLACVFWGFAFLFRGQPLAASLALGAGALTRYEGWLALGVAAAYRVASSAPPRRRALPSALLLFGWAPALWMILQHGLSPEGTFVLDARLSWARFHRPYFIARSAFWWSDAAMAGLALLPLVRLLPWRRDPAHLRPGVLILFVALLLGALVFSGHGIQPDPERLVTEREAFVPIGFLVLFAGLGIGLLDRYGAALPVAGGRWLAPAALLVGTAYGVTRGVARVADANDDPELRVDVEVAGFLRAAQGAALVLAAPLPRAEIERFVEQAARWGGETGRRRAREVLAALDTGPFDYQRIVVHAWEARRRILSPAALAAAGAGGLDRLMRDRDVRYAVVFADFEPSSEAERLVIRRTASAELLRQVRYGPKAARVYGLAGGPAGRSKPPGDGPAGGARGAP